MNLGQVFQRAVSRAPGAVAFVEGARRQTFAQWYDDVRRVARGLQALGVRPGDHVGAVMKNRWEMATLAWASYMAGAVFTPISWRGTADEIGYCLKDSGAVVCVYDGAAGIAAATACDQIQLAADKRIAAADAGDGFDALLSQGSVEGPTDVADGATALMLYTSGTTGRPKGVPRSHRAEWSATLSHIALNDYPRDLSQLCVMPLFHTMGLRTLEACAFLGGKMICLPNYSAGAVLDSIEQEKIGGIFLVPTMYHDILNHPDIADRDLSSVIRAGFAGMTMAPSLIQKCCATFQRAKFINFYGSSEIYTLSVSDHQAAKPGNAGRPGLYQELRIVQGDPDRRIMPHEVVAPGETGEIILNMDAPDAFQAYWNRPESNRKAIREGWYYTGDLGRLDEDGDLWVLGRVDDMIISGGENIHPEEVEDVLLRSGLCRDVVVIGLPDERMGQRVIAFVEAKEGASPAALDAACQAGALAKFKRPRAYVFIEAIPRTASGKLLRRKLRDGEYEVLDRFGSTA
ncbi:MAG: AMP-binding protein [Proteobacteria bacterium]|nr:AMP-binding protein [Pseudomonadota bacterium]